MYYILLATCRDLPGISAAVTGFLANSNGFILDSAQFGDPQTNQFFLRIAFRAAEGDELALEGLRSGFLPIAKPL